MLFVALVVNPLIVWYKIRRNPYPLVLAVPARKRRDRIFHPQLCRQHPCEHGNCQASELG